jgi:flagellar hook-associated protein 2
MVTSSGSVSLGSLSGANGAPRLSGTSSELDTEKLVEALVAAKRLPADRLEQRITRNEAKIAAYGELRGLLSDLKSAVAGLRNPPGVLGVQENLFERKEVYYSADATTSPASLLSVSAANKVPPGRFEVVVERLATARKLAGDALAGDGLDLATAANGGSALSGAITLGLAGGGSATIAVDGTMDLQNVRAAVNARSAETGIAASVIKVSAGDYRLVLTAAETGKEVVLASAGGDDILGVLGLSADGGATFKNPLAAPQTAQLRIDGVTVTRAGNQIADVIDGVTLNLFKAEPGTTVTVEVERSLSGVKDQLVGFAEAYNALRDFVARHSAVSDTGAVDEDAALFGDALLRSLTQAVSGAVASPVAGLPAGTTGSLAGLGLRLGGDNRLTLDGKRLDDALLADLDAVRGALEFRFEASSPELGILSRTNGLADHAFTVGIVDADADGVPESASADGVALDIQSGKLTGRAGTAYAGLQMLWVGRGGASIDVTATQGVADRLYNILDAAADDLNGSLTRAADDLAQRNVDYRAEIGRIGERAERYRQRLIERFGAMETALSLAKSMLQQVQVSIAAFSREG